MRTSRISIPLVAIIFAATLGVATAAAQEEVGDWATPEQVERGRAAYEQKCSTCHGSDIVSIFKSFPSAGQFFGFISTTMPGDAPGSLPAQQYADIIAYLAAENGMKTGTEELPPDPEALNSIRPSEFAQ
ncbi:cytochrome c [Pelagibacterium sp. 26DY04]|uniref:c-type cytochrome n=1 Tax=Pelagibacterium sp. 26DY04 TaxID=2967130 RepID=UPI002814D077|nr:cytochrome c [Pelagibacterium sp. 26DY04]WMT88561.1 cytochrome c [Pelagibacterium sp. 26DY04]